MGSAPKWRSCFTMVVLPPQHAKWSGRNPGKQTTKLYCLHLAKKHGSVEGRLFLGWPSFCPLDSLYSYRRCVQWALFCSVYCVCPLDASFAKVVKKQQRKLLLSLFQPPHVWYWRAVNGLNKLSFLSSYAVWDSGSWNSLKWLEEESRIWRKKVEIVVGRWRRKWLEWEGLNNWRRKVEMVGGRGKLKWLKEEGWNGWRRKVEIVEGGMLKWLQDECWSSWRKKKVEMIEEGILQWLKEEGWNGWGRELK